MCIIIRKSFLFNSCFLASKKNRNYGVWRPGYAKPYPFFTGAHCLGQTLAWNYTLSSSSIVSDLNIAIDYGLTLEKSTFLRTTTPSVKFDMMELQCCVSFATDPHVTNEDLFRFELFFESDGMPQKWRRGDESEFRSRVNCLMSIGDSLLYHKYKEAFFEKGLDPDHAFSNTESFYSKKRATDAYRSFASRPVLDEFFHGPVLGKPNMEKRDEEFKGVTPWYRLFQYPLLFPALPKDKMWTLRNEISKTFSESYAQSTSWREHYNPGNWFEGRTKSKKVSIDDFFFRFSYIYDVILQLADIDICAVSKDYANFANRVEDPSRVCEFSDHADFIEFIKVPEVDPFTPYSPGVLSKKLIEYHRCRNKLKWTSRNYTMLKVLDLLVWIQKRHERGLFLPMTPPPFYGKRGVAEFGRRVRFRI